MKLEIVAGLVILNRFPLQQEDEGSLRQLQNSGCSKAIVDLHMCIWKFIENISRFFRNFGGAKSLKDIYNFYVVKIAQSRKGL